MTSRALTVPPIFHFVWFGATFVEFGLVAIRSALVENPGSRAILWHGDELEITPELRAIESLGLRFERIDPVALVERAKKSGASFDPHRLLRIYQSLKAPAAKSNLVRLLALYSHGGIYLDTDTITLKPLTELCQAGGFCGVEHVLWPTGRALLHPGAIALGEIRRLCATVSWLYPLHKRMLRYYSQSANNAVLGFAPAHPFCDRLLLGASQLPEAQWTRRYRLGTHLLQQALSDQDGRADAQDEQVLVLPPRYFYPVGPVVSRLYLRKTRDVEALRKELLHEDTAIIHWYASVSQLKARGFRHIRANQGSEVYSSLCARYLPSSTS